MPWRFWLGMRVSPEFSGLFGPLTPDRDEHGHFTTAYAARWRKDVPAGETDARWTDDESKALARNLQNLRLLSLSDARHTSGRTGGRCSGPGFGAGRDRFVPSGSNRA